MSGAGYGNHDATLPGSAAAEPPDAKAGSAKASSAAMNRPGTDLGGAGDVPGTSGQMAGTRTNPDSTGAGPHSGSEGSTSPSLSDDDRRERTTPSDGAGVGPVQAGHEADPGLG